MNAFLAAPAVLVLSPLLAGQSVHVLAKTPGPGVDFTSFPAAFAGVSSGDILIVRPGSYGTWPELLPTTIAGKGITVIGEESPYSPWISIDDVPAGETFVWRGMGGSVFGTEANQCDGVVWIEEAGLPADSNPGSGDSSNFEARDCASLIIQRSTFKGADASFSAGDVGLYAHSSSAWVHDTRMFGGFGFFHPGSGLISGGFAAVVFDTDAFFSGCEFDQSGVIPQSPGEAGQGGDSSTQLLDSPDPWEVSGGVQTTLPVEARHFEATAINLEGESIVFTFEAPAGELAILNLTTTPAGAFLPSFASAGLISTPLLLLQSVGTIPASGTLEYSIPVPFFPAGFEGITLFGQGSFADLTAGTVRLGGGSAFVVVDEGYGVG